MNKKLVNEIAKQLKQNAFCPTGPGGGVDPSCGKEGGGAVPSGMIEVFHGTRDTLLKKIAKSGLKAGLPSIKKQKWVKGAAMLKEQPKGVYHVKTAEEAIKWANIAADTSGKIKGSVIVVARVPKSWVKKDPVVEGAHYVDRDIPPSMLVKSMTVKFVPNKPGDFKGKHKIVGEQSFTNNAKEETEDVYVVMAIDEDG